MPVAIVEVGDTVRAGDPLFEIAPDPTPQELLNVDHGVRSSEASFLKAEGDFRRGQELFDDGLTSKGDLDALRETYELARIARQQAADNRQLTRSGRVSGGDTEVEAIIRTPASGTVLSRAVNVGDPVVPLTSYQPGTELASVADMSDLIFKGTVDEIDVGKITVGMPCRIKVGALPDRPVIGRLSRISPQAQKSEGATLFDVEIELEPDQGVLLRAGYSANADVVIREKTGILLIPERLVLFEDDNRPSSNSRARARRPNRARSRSSSGCQTASTWRSRPASSKATRSCRGRPRKSADATRGRQSRWDGRVTSFGSFLRQLGPRPVEPEAAYLPDRFRHHLGHGGGQSCCSPSATGCTGR